MVLNETVLYSNILRVCMYVSPIRTTGRSVFVHKERQEKGYYMQYYQQSGEHETETNHTIAYRQTPRFPRLSLPRNLGPLFVNKINTSIDTTRRISRSHDLTPPLDLLQSESTDNRNTAIIFTTRHSKRSIFCRLLISRC